MIALWSMPKPEYDGQVDQFKGVNAMPRPVQKPHPEIVFGGILRKLIAVPRGWRRDGTASRRTWTGPKCVEGCVSACKAWRRRSRRSR